MPKLRVISNLESFQTTDDLDGMWNVLRPVLAHRIGKSRFVCLPHITDGNCYGIGGVLIKTEQTGFLCSQKRTFLPLGPLEDLIDKQNTKDYWNTHHPILFTKSRKVGLRGCFKPSRGDTIMEDGLARAGFTIVLEDLMGYKELKLNVESIHTRSLPPEISPVDTIVFDRSKHPELANVQEIYIVTNVKEVDRLELTGIIGPRARVFHIINRYPLYFTYQKYKLDQEGKVYNKVKSNPSYKRTTWIRKNNTDKLDDVPRPDWETFKEI